MGTPDPSFQWGVYGFNVSPSVSSEESEEIGKGKINTGFIVNYHDDLGKRYSSKGDYYQNYRKYSNANDGTVAAKLCQNAEINGYTDWFLPTKEELGLMYENLHAEGKGEFQADKYWSSVDLNSTFAGVLNFEVGVITMAAKSSTARIRPVRVF
jgi:hypothetical protein